MYNTQVKDIPTDGMAKYGRVEDHQVLVRSRISIATFEGIRKGEINRLGNGHDYRILKLKVKIRHTAHL
jgi:hypothetical protein